VKSAFGRSIAYLCLALVPLTIAACNFKPLPAVKEGDLIFQTSKSSQSVAIQRATDSQYSHIGMIFLREGKPTVFEASATVRYTPLEKWIARGDGKHFVVKRLALFDKLMPPESLERLRSEANRFAGKPYDLTFEWSDQRIYCSELVWKVYKNALNLEIGHLQKLRDFHLDDPAVQQKMKERYGTNVPMDEPVISPVAMFNSDLLVTVDNQ
jgi:hypothetical protein